MHSISLDSYGEHTNIGHGEDRTVIKPASNTHLLRGCVDTDKSASATILIDSTATGKHTSSLVARKDTDENDNNSCDATPTEMRPSALERILNNTEHSYEVARLSQQKNSPYRNRSIHSFPDQRSVVPYPHGTSEKPMKQCEMKLDQSQHHSTAIGCTSPNSGIIFHRTYIKKPSPAVTRNVEDRLRSVSPGLHPVICLEDIRWRISLANRHGNDDTPPGTGVLSNADFEAGRSNAARSCIIRRSFHKDSLVIPNIAKITLEQESSQSDGAKEDSPQFRRRFSYSNVKKERHATASVIRDNNPVRQTAGAHSAQDWMEVCDGMEGQQQLQPKMEPHECNGTLSARWGNEVEETVEASSMANSYGDDGSSGWSKHFSTQPSTFRREPPSDGRQMASEFDLMLQKINQNIPPMSHMDRIAQWRVTAEDLLHSIPTKAQIETSFSCAKRPFYDATVHLSSDEDSDTLADDAGEAAVGACPNGGQMRGTKKRRTFNEEASGLLDESSSMVIASPMRSKLPFGGNGDCDGLDFRKSQVNPEIDKPTESCIRILARKNYHKLPTRYRPGAGFQCERHEETNDESGLSGKPPPSVTTKPYAHLLSRDEEEREKFLQYLRISPVFRTNNPQASVGSRRGTQDENCSGVVAIANRADSCDRRSNTCQPDPETPVRSLSKSKKSLSKEKQNKKKPTSKGKGHPSIIASSGLRGIRRLVLNSSLRSGRIIRYRNSFTNVRQLSKPKAKELTNLNGANKELPNGELLSRSSKNCIDESSEHGYSVPVVQNLNKEQQSSTPVPSPSSSSTVTKKAKRSTQRRRCSVDSAVSSSTSAEMLEQAGKRSRECQTVETFPPMSSIAAPLPAVVNEGKRLRNPLNRVDGEVLHVFLLGEQLVVVQKELVSFWRYSRLSVLLGVKQEWQRIGQIRRWNRDTEVDMQNANRIVFNQQDPIYLEPRARNLSDDKSRTCPLASIYLNAYFIDTGVAVAPRTKFGETTGSAVTVDDGGVVDEEESADASGEQLRLKSFQLDTVKSKLEDIRFVPLPNTRDFIVCWHEHVSELESRTGLCKYSLTPDLQTLACIREFACVKQRLVALKCINDKKLLGLGTTTVHIWCYESGFLLRTVDLKIELGLIVACFLHIEADDNTLVMLQIQQPENSASLNRKLLKSIAINLGKPTWYIAHSFEIALASMSITSESQQWALDDHHSNHRHCLTFDSGELLLVSLNDPTVCWTNHQRLEKDLLRAESGSLHIYSRLRSNDGVNDFYRPRERILNGCHWNNGRDLVFLSDQSLMVKSIDEYMLDDTKR
ncbi:uncharacterized protein LOC128724020 [Anopheles nili]|uniref:uncharacterized protein LOC128724020 n=1 Tax=Anopheles nili TaxID=185578 RepID=UPI00237B4E76|nr:uncharacterized protein LOC128724020 [Anopheles nili]